MSSIRESLIAYLVDRLNEEEGYEGIFRRNRALVGVDSDSPTVLVIPSVETVDGSKPGYISVRRLTVLFIVYARGSAPDSAADTLCSLVHSVVMEDETQDGNAMSTVPGQVVWRYSIEDMDAVEVTLSYEFVYNVLRNDFDNRP